MLRYKLYKQTAQGALHELTSFVQSLTWSGSTKQITRQLELALAITQEDALAHLPALHDALVLFVDGAQEFTGRVVQRARDSTSQLLKIKALDGGWNLAQNRGFYSFRAVQADEAVRTLCRDFGVQIGHLAAGGGAVSRKFAGVSLDKIIRTLYSLRAEADGGRYHARMSGTGALEVLQKPQDAALVIAPRINSMGIKISEDISKLCTQVVIYSDEGKRIRALQGEAYHDFGVTLSHIIVQKKGKDAAAEAQSFLEDNGLAQSISADVLGDTRLLSGNAVRLLENRSGLVGLCWIESDTHSFKNGQYFCNLKLDVKNLMQKESGGSEIK